MNKVSKVFIVLFAFCLTAVSTYANTLTYSKGDCPNGAQWWNVTEFGVDGCIVSSHGKCCDGSSYRYTYPKPGGDPIQWDAQGTTYNYTNNVVIASADVDFEVVVFDIQTGAVMTSGNFGTANNNVSINTASFPPGNYGVAIKKTVDNYIIGYYNFAR